MTYIYTVDLWYIFTGVAAQIRGPLNVGTLPTVKASISDSRQALPSWNGFGRSALKWSHFVLVTVHLPSLPLSQPPSCGSQRRLPCLVLHEALRVVGALGRALQLGGRQVLQLIVSILRDPGCELPHYALLLALLVLNNLLELVASIFWLGSQWAGWHSYAKNIWHHVGAQPAHQRSASRAVVGLLVVEEKPIHLQERKPGMRRDSGAHVSRRAMYTAAVPMVQFFLPGSLPDDRESSFSDMHLSKWRNGLENEILIYRNIHSTFPFTGCFPTHYFTLLKCVLVTQLCPTLCDPMDYSPPGSSVHGMFQARILEWVAIPFSKGSSRPRDGICLLHCRQIFYRLSHQESPISLSYPPWKCLRVGAAPAPGVLGHPPNTLRMKEKSTLSPGLLSSDSMYFLPPGGPRSGGCAPCREQSRETRQAPPRCQTAECKGSSGQAASISGCLNLPLNCLNATFWETQFFSTGRPPTVPYFLFCDSVTHL